MSLFGKMMLSGKDLQLRPEMRALLDEASKEAYLCSPDDVICEEQLRVLYDHLEVIMYFAILCHVPGKHLEAFAKMNDEKRSRDGEENMPHAEEVLNVPLLSSGNIIGA